ncbi:MAG: type II secretion system F family protein [Planctomycetota bacterium]|nr:MAG: type II secretion system F family protein [Planctomycetota bacterium]
MPLFTIEAMDQKGNKLRKDIEASSKQEAVKKVRSMGYYPTKVKQKKGGSGKKEKETSPGMSARQAIAKQKKSSFTFGGVSQKQLTQFTQQLSILQDAGLPIVRSLRILEGQLKPCALKTQLEAIANDVEGGSTFSEALAKHPKTFDKLYVNMIKAGEAGGVLDTILERLAIFQEKSLKLRKKVLGAMVYPVAVITIAVLILTGIMIFVIPAFKKMFKESNVQTPMMTELLLSIADFVKVWWWAILIVIPATIIITYKMIVKSPSGRFAVDKIKLNIPIFGMIIRKSTISRFTRTLGTLIASGVPILEALGIVKDAVGNEVVAKAVENVYNSIKEGESIAGPLKESKIFDDLVVNMIDVGEETGELDKMLMKISDTYDDDVDVAVESMTSLMEPILIIGMGATVGFIVIALFMPLISLISNIGG